MAVISASHGRDFDGAGGEDSDRSIGGFETFFFDDAAKTGLKAAEQDDLSAPHVGCVGGCVQAPDRLEGVADRVNTRGFGRAQHGTQDSGKHVHVLMGVDMRETKAETLQQGNLRGGFGFDFCGADARGEEALQETAQSGIKEAGGSIEREGMARLSETGVPSTRTTWQPTPSVGMARAIFTASSVAGSLRHEGGAGEHFGSVKLEDGAIDSGSEPKVVRVHDKSGHED